MGEQSKWEWLVQQIEANATRAQIRLGAAEHNYKFENLAIAAFQVFGADAITMMQNGTLMREYDALRIEVIELDTDGYSPMRIVRKLQGKVPRLNCQWVSNVVSYERKRRNDDSRMRRCTVESKPKRKTKAKPGPKPKPKSDPKVITADQMRALQAPANELPKSVEILLVELVTEMRIANIERLTLDQTGQVDVRIKTQMQIKVGGAT